LKRWHVGLDPGPERAGLSEPSRAHIPTALL